MDDMLAIFAWTEVDPDSGEGVITTMMPALDNRLCNLQSRKLEVAQQLRPLAEAHHRATGHRVRLVRFLRDDVLEDIPGI